MNYPERCGIILAGGVGSRLFPITRAVCKQLLPIYDKPLIYYPLTTLKNAGIKDILIIVSSVPNMHLFQHLLEDGSAFDLNLKYEVQDQPRGLADAFIVGKEFIGNRSVALALGDNIFYGELFNSTLKNIPSHKNTIFGCKVSNPEAYGVAAFDGYGNMKKVIEKPTHYVSDYAIPGLYFFDNTVIQKAVNLMPSARGELEIVDIINSYLKEDNLDFIKLPRGTVWFDTGTPDHLLEAAEFIKAIQSRTGILVGHPSFE